MKDTLIKRFISDERFGSYSDIEELNHIRNFRNRVFHYEKVLNKNNYNKIFDEIDEILCYFDKELLEFSKKANNG